MTLDELILTVPEGFDWLVRSDEAGGFANLTSGGAEHYRIHSAGSGCCFPTFGSTPAIALEVAIRRARNFHKGGL